MLGSIFHKLFPSSQDVRTAPAIAMPIANEAVEQEATALVSETGGQDQLIALSSANILVAQKAGTKQDVLKVLAARMLELGYVSSDYLEPLLVRENKVNTFMCNGIAIPHGTNEAKGQVSKTGVVIMQLPQGVTWGNNGEKAHLVIGIAAKGDDHMELLQQLATVAMDEELALHLGTNASIIDIAKALGGSKEMTESRVENSVEPFDIERNCKVVDVAGIHARPASSIAELANQFQNTAIQILFNDKSVNAKSMAAVLNLGARLGDELTIAGRGDEAENAVQTIVDAINAGLDSDDDTHTSNAHYQQLSTLKALNNPVGRVVLRGAAASSGIAMAPAFILRDMVELTTEATAVEGNQQSRLDDAIKVAASQLDTLQKELGKSAVSEAAIFKAHSQILRDPDILGEVHALISGGVSAAKAWHSALSEQIALLEKSDNKTVRGRATDMKDVMVRVLTILGNGSCTLEFPQTPFVLIARELTPSQTAQLASVPVKAICTELGGPNSHMAILARALGIPAIVGVGDQLIGSIEENDNIVVDPQSSAVVIAPDSNTTREADSRINDWMTIQQEENASRHLPAITLDGHEVQVVCNIAQTSDAPAVIDCGAEGVGLLRTEFLFETSPVEPTVAEQIVALSAIAETLKEKILVIRTADIGADKPVSWMPLAKEDNPFLGCRGIRLSFKYEEMFRRQLEAIYAVAKQQYDNGIKSGIHIMFPMISTMNEWRKARDIAEAVREKVGAPKLPLGIMIEVPSAVLLADHFAREVDFFSIGSNDLTQYTLAVDRMHPELCNELDNYNPALLKMMAMAIAAANAKGKWVGVCGNMAGIPDITRLLVGMGVTELSVSPANVAAVKQLIRSLNYQELRALTKHVLTLETAEQVHSALQ